MSRNKQTLGTYLDGFVMRDGKIAERRARMIEFKEDDSR
jgi:hypothetical protein